MQNISFLKTLMSQPLNTAPSNLKKSQGNYQYSKYSDHSDYSEYSDSDHSDYSDRTCFV